MNQEIKPAVIEDSEAILTLQRLAYQSEAAIYDDFTIPPLTRDAGRPDSTIPR